MINQKSQVFNLKKKDTKVEYLQNKQPVPESPSEWNVN